LEWSIHSARAKGKFMKHKVVRTLLYIPLLLVAAFDIAYAIVALTGLLDRSLVAWLPRTSFSDSTILMLLLAIVVGGSSFLAAITVFLRREWSVLLSVAAGFIMVGWEVMEVALSRQFSWMQPLFMTLGLAVLGLAFSLWMTEYRGHSFLIRHLSHA
jgi:hypothetical protein